MRIKHLQLALMALMLMFANNMFAQRTVKGVLVDAANGEALIGASVVVKGTTNGTITSIDGGFSLAVPAGDQTLVLSFVGFVSQEVAVAKGVDNIGTVKMKSDAVGLDEVSVIASVAIARRTPVAVSTVNPVVIQEKLGTQEFPEILKATPSVYATKQGGGYGDSRVNVRGFNSRNIAVMINGVPVNDMENGWVYWSNWAGLADVTRSMQVQRGLGASKIATPAVGGSINILTTTTDAKKGGSIFTMVGNDGTTKSGFSLSTGLNEKGWAVTVTGAQSKGDGYVDGTSYKGYSYFMNISKRINEAHTLAFSVFGAPQEHGQRSYKMDIETYRQYGLRYNDRWGYRNGQVLNSAVNYYHKPQAILNHFWTISEKTSLNTALYASVGTGGGTGTYGSFPSYRREGQIDFDRIVDENIANGDGGSLAILRSSRNDHEWYGLLSNFSTMLNDNLTLTAGLDLRSYVGHHFREVTDLLGGDFFIDKYTGSNGDINNQYKTVRVGDKIGYYNDGRLNWYGVFGQLEYTMDKLSAFVSAAGSSTTMQRIDYFRYLEGEQESEKLTFPSFSVKAGANYNLTSTQNIFFNTGYFSRYPDFNTAFPNNRNETNDGAKNESTFSVELGYGFKGEFFSANVNLYRTQWMDKNFVKRYTTQDGEFYANISGVDALHQGIELDFILKPAKWAEITGMVSFGDWVWANNLEGVKVYDDTNTEIGTVNVFVENVHVGDAAQKTAALGLNFDVMEGLRVGADFNYYKDLYAEFDPIGRSVAPDAGADNPDSWKMPDYGLVDLFVRYNFNLGDFKATVSGKVNNLLNTEYMTEATDGALHNWETAQVYYGLGRTWSLSFKVKF